ncbi:hypothetical protein [Hyphococcus sp.]|uniref:hypothetical protein n=1 Tax=Hyphococcus sp. TaxID=2038636 RepID=UPI002081FDBD|nr:MAG: hypothetical protein DHS20C04_21280 [Marinicaulis sp.]
MNTAIRAAGARYDVRPSGEKRGFYGGPARSLACMIKDAAQGAGAGFLSLTGATSIASGETIATGGDFGLLSSVFPSLAASGMTGPMQLIGGAVLFLAARRTISRTAGLMAFIAFLAAYANGFTLVDMLGAASSVLDQAAGALATVPVAESA